MEKFRGKVGFKTHIWGEYILGTERIKDRKVGLDIIMFKDRKAFKVNLRTERIRYIRFEDR